MSFQEILRVKDDILKNNRELEEKIKSHIDTYGDKFQQDINSFSKRIKKVSDSNDSFIKTLPDINFKLSKIDQIEKFNVRTDHKMSSFEVRISSLLDQIEKIKTKYDKIILDNLYVSGQIGGPHCPFANLSEYLLSNINDVNLLKLEKDQLKKDLKNIKMKNDNVIKQTVNLVDGSVKRCNEYTDNKQKDFQSLLDTKMREFNEKIMEIRMNVCKIQMQTEESVNNLNIAFDKMKEENKFFTDDLMLKFNEIKNELIQFKTEQKSKINLLNKDNTFIKKDIQNIKQNLETMIKYIEYNYNKISQQENNEPVDLNKNKRRNLKASYLGTVRMNINSPIKNSRLPIMSPNIRKNQKNNNMFNSINNNINNYKQKFGGEIQRTKKKRNTIAFTGQIFNEQMREKFKDKIKESEKEKEKERRESPKFLGLLSPLLKNIVNFKFEDKDKSIDISNNSLNTKDKFDLNLINKSIKSNKNKNKNKKRNNESNSSYTASKKKSLNKTSTISSNNSNSGSESNTSSASEANKVIKEVKNIRCSSSRKNTRRLTLKREHKKEKELKANKILEKVNILNNNKINNEQEHKHKHNKKNRRRGSLAVFKSVNNMYKNNDISDILTKKFSNQIENYSQNKKRQILQINNMKNSSDEDTKNNYNINNNNISINLKDKNKDKDIIINGENKYKYSNQKSKYLNLPSTSGGNRLINNYNYNDTNKKIGINLNMKQFNSSNNNNNIYNIYTQENLSKNHKVNYILTPKKEKEKEKIVNGCKIVSFELPENSNLPQKVNQLYSLNGKKLKNKPKIKTELTSPLEEIYKQQFKKKMKDAKNFSNTNMQINTGDDVQKKLLPIFGRTAYIFYNKQNKDGGINLTNSMEVNKNKNDFNNNFFQIGRNSYYNNLQLSVNTPFNIKTFPKIQKKYNTEKNE